jgi:hypothetical protein
LKYFGGRSYDNQFGGVIEFRNQKPECGMKSAKFGVQKEQPEK